MNGDNNSMRCAFLAAALAIALGGRVHAANNVAGSMITINDNGGWSWFEDERAVIDVAANKLVIGTVGNAAGFDGAARNGDIDVTSIDLTTHATARFTLKDNYEADDHDSPALYIRPDGRYVAMYAGHIKDNFSRWRISTNPGDVTSWSSEQTVDNGAGATYSNLYFLPNDNGGAGRLYNFVRSVGFDPNIMTSNDQGSTWSFAGRLLTEGGDSDRPYLRYASDGNKIQLMTTNRHPRDFNNSVYAGYVQDGKLYNSSGAVIDANVFDAAGMAPSALTTVFAANTVVGGASMQRAWTVDTGIDPAGNPVGVIQARANGSNQDHRFFYSRWDGSQWQVNPMAYAGSSIYAAEDDYTGLAAIDPRDVNTVYISTEVNPTTQAQLIGADGLRHYELFRGKTLDNGATWKWAPVTFNSTTDNLRPVVPKWDETHTALVWLRGKYTTYTNYNLRDVTLLNPSVSDPVPVVSVDFGTTGQLVQSGFAAFTRDENPAGTAQTEMFASSFANGGQLSVTVGGGDVQFRDRGDNVAGPIGDLADDFVFNASMLSLTLGNLQAGDYQLVLHGHDRDAAQTGYRIVLDGVELGRMTPTTGAAPLVGTASSRVQFHANGVSDVVFSLESLASANVTLNGFELYSAPAYASPPAVDLNSDGLLDLADYLIYIGGMHKNLTGMSASAAYAMGDLNGDFLNNFADLQIFRQAYNLSNGQGAFEAAFGIPEPTAAVLSAFALIGLGIRRKRANRASVSEVPAPGEEKSGRSLRPVAILSLTLAALNWLAADAHAELLTGWGLETGIAGATLTEGVPGAFTVTAPTTNAGPRALMSTPITFASTGDLVQLSGTVTLTNSPGNQQFRFGLYNTNGKTTGTLSSGVWTGADPTGWLGYMLQLGGGNGNDSLKGRNVPSANSWLANAETYIVGNGPAAAPSVPAATPYKFTITLARLGATSVRTDYSFVGGTVNRTGSFTDNNLGSSAATTSFNAAGFLLVPGSGAQFTGVTIEVPKILRLRVNTTNGFVSIANKDATTTFTPNYYEITSPMGSLTPASWLSLDGDVPASPTTWEKAGGSSATILSETNLLGTQTFSPQGPFAALGKAFTPGGTQDLSFRYGLPNGTLQTGLVEYVTGGPAGDFDVDGDVDGRDFAVWQRGLGTAFTAANLTDWRNTFGTVTASPAAGAVPEPAAATLVVAATVLCGSGCRGLRPRSLRNGVLRGR